MRLSGYYWVRYGNEWRIFFYYQSFEQWDKSFIDSDFDEIDEKRIERTK